MRRISSKERHEAELMILAARLDLVMSEQSVSQAELARRMQTNPATVSKMLKGADSKVSTYLTAFDALGYALEVLPKSA